MKKKTRSLKFTNIEALNEYYEGSDKNILLSGEKPGIKNKEAKNGRRRNN